MLVLDTPLVATSPLDALTARERQVLALLAQGLTDRGISENLWLTPKTVETHVRHILTKLNLPTGVHHNRRVLAVLTYIEENTSRLATTDGDIAEATGLVRCPPRRRLDL